MSSFATGAGTLVLAIATFGAVRSANRAARTAERALQAGLRPLLMHSRLDDPPQKIMWLDRHWAAVLGALEARAGVVRHAARLLADRRRPEMRRVLVDQSGQRALQQS